MIKMANRIRVTSTHKTISLQNEKLIVYNKKCIVKTSEIADLLLCHLLLSNIFNWFLQIIDAFGWAF